ncbi:MAG: amino acid racemase [Candidatus Bipolaricaulota bacterium]|nr:amino acid racemase [Candidatus Bipolaricaulota bacterium]
MSERIVGVLGGMGPEATVELLKRIIDSTPARCDQEHIRVLIDNNPKIPDRTAAILAGGEDPLPMMIAGARGLECAGADFILIPCNTAHHWLPGLQGAVSIPIVDMIGETVGAVSSSAPPIKLVGLLATTGTIKTRLYQRALEGEGISTAIPTAEEQDEVMNAIDRIKAGDHGVRRQLMRIIERLITQGAKGLILGCTELPLVIQEEDVTCPLFDPLSILAQRAVKLAKGG